jgi:hypothetical protein
VHAHTGVKTHLIGPADRRMVARCRVGVPTHASVRVERRRESAASASTGAGCRVGRGSPVPCRERSGTHRANTPVGCRTRSIDHYPIPSIHI